MAKHYGGVSEDSDERGKAAYKALLAGGSSGFSPCSADSSGRHQRVIRPVDGSTTLVEAGKLSIVKAAARSGKHFPFGVSDD
jgi:hypothetical protein